MALITLLGIMLVLSTYAILGAPSKRPTDVQYDSKLQNLIGGVFALGEVITPLMVSFILIEYACMQKFNCSIVYAVAKYHQCGTH